MIARAFAAVALLLAGAAAAAPPASRLAFVCEGNIWTAPPDGSGLRRLTTGLPPASLKNSGDHDTSPAWSPGRRRIAFGSNRAGPRAIYVMNADGSGVRRVTRSRGGAVDATPSWSPDGRRIAFVSGGVKTMAAGGGDIRTVAARTTCRQPDW